MKNYAFLLAVTALGVVAATVTADAGQRVVVGPYGGTKTVTTGIDEYGASRTVTRTSPYGGTMTATQNCAPGAYDCQRAMQATGAYGRTVSGSATVSRAPGHSVTTGTIVGPSGGVYNRTVTRNW